MKALGVLGIIAVILAVDPPSDPGEYAVAGATTVLWIGIAARAFRGRYG